MQGWTNRSAISENHDNYRATLIILCHNCCLSLPNNNFNIMTMFLSLADSYIYVDLKNARSGDIATLTSPLIQNEAAMCIHIDYRLKGNVQLDISYKVNGSSLEKIRTCALIPDDLESWNSTDILIPYVGQPIVLYFDAAILSPKHAGVDLDNITLTDNENCTVTILEGAYRFTIDLEF